MCKFFKDKKTKKLLKMIEILKLIGLPASVIGAYFVASGIRKYRLFAFCIWIIANIIWLINSLIISDYTQSMLWIFYILTCLIGIKNNVKKNEK